MSQCYKCGKELPEGQVECEPFCRRGTDMSDEDIEEAVREFERTHAAIDFSKVKTLEDVLLVLPHIADAAFVRIDRDSPEFEKLKPYLKL